MSSNNPAAEAEAPDHRSLWSRVVVLFAALAAIKAAILFSMSEQLFTAHWRWTSKSVGWFDHVNYWFFVTFASTSLVVIGMRAKTASASCVRNLITTLSIIGLIFTLLMRQQFERNYLYTYMLGLLDFSALGHYLYLDACFAQPFLAAYVFVGVFLYWLCWRNGRSHWCFFVLAAMTFIYFALNKSGFDVRDGKWVQLNCFAAAGFIAWFAFRKGISLGTVALPLATIVGWWLAFAREGRDLLHPHAYLQLLLAITVAAFLPAVVSLRKSALYGTVSCFLPFYVLSFMLLANANYGPARNYDMLSSWALVAPHYFATELTLVALAGAAAWRIARHSQRAAQIAIDGVAILLITLTLTDLIVLRKLGVRIDWNLLTMSDDLSKVWSLVRPHLPALAASLAALIGIYLGAVQLLRRAKPAIPRNGDWHCHPTAAFSLVCFALLALTASKSVGHDSASYHSLVQIAQSSPLLKQLSVKRWNSEELVAHARALQLEAQGVPVMQQRRLPALTTNLNVVLVIMESSYNRYLSLFGAADKTQPRLAAFRDRMELFPNIFSTFPNSLHARFSIYNGLYPTVEYPSYLNPRIPSPSLFELLHDSGYTTELFYSSTRHYTRMNDYLGHRKIDLFHDCDSMPGRERHEKLSWGVSETATLEAMKEQLSKHAHQDQPFFLSYIPAAPHQPFEKPAKEFQKFDDSTAKVDHNYTGAYQNQLLYMDWVLSSLVEHLEVTGLLDKTVVLITNDHGEMVGEADGKLGHGWFLKPELCNTPLIVMDPRRRGATVNTTFGSQVDLLPTVLDLLKLPLPPGELYQGLSLYDPKAQEPRPIYLHSYRDRALVLNGEYLWLENYHEGMDEAQAITRRFGITNEGSRTDFTELPAAASILRQHLEFERYQHSFIVHYGYYRDQLANKRAVDSQATAHKQVATVTGLP